MMAGILLDHKPSPNDCIVYFLLTTVFMGMASSATVSLKGNISPCKPPCTEYGMVITARLERVELKIYKIARRAVDVIPKVSDVHQVAPNPGRWQIDIGAIQKRRETFYPILKLIVKTAKKVIPRLNQFSTPVFFLMLQSDDGVYRKAFKAMSLMVTKFLNNLNNHPFLPPSKQSIRIVKGKSEIMFKWLTANFLAGYFENSHSKVGVLSLSQNTVTQIAFPVHITSTNVTEFVIIGTEPYLLVAQSHTASGFETSLRKYFIGLNQRNSANKESPCTPKGTRIQVADGSVYKEFIGNGNVKECRQIINDLILNDYDRWTQSPYVRRPSKSIQFFVLPEVLEVLKAIECPGCAKVFTPAKIDSAARKYCSRRNSASGNLRSTKNCLNANFFYIMLTRAYHFADDFPIAVLPKSKHGIAEHWTLGAFLYKLRLLSFEKRR